MAKYLLQQPKTLEILSIDTLAACIALQAKKFVYPISEQRPIDAENEAQATLSRQIETMRNHFYCNMPKKFHDGLASRTITELLSLLEKTLSDNVWHIYDSQRNAIGRLTETLFTEKLTSLSINVDNFYVYTMLRDPLCNNSHRLAGLIRLELHFEMLPLNRRTENTEFDYIFLLGNLCSLKYLTLQYVCTGEILRCIVVNCNYIEVLDVSSSINVSDDSINILTELPYLRIINLNKTSVRQKGIETVLLSCKNIEQIIPASNDRIGESDMAPIFNRIAFSEEKFPKLFRITTYKSDNDTLKDLKLIVQMCPLIRNLSVRVYFYRSIRQSDNIMAITDLRGLRELSLDGYCFHSEVKDVLQAIGRDLVSLNLQRVRQMDLNALIDISQLCPHLQNLLLDSCSFITNQKPQSDTNELGTRPFQNLKKLILLNISHNSKDIVGNLFGAWSSLFRGQYDSDGLAGANWRPHLDQRFQLIDDVVFFLLSNCLSVEFIQLSRSPWLTEEFMLRVLNKNPLIYLKELRIFPYVSLNLREHEAITSLVLDRIIQNCIHCPEVILEVSHKFLVK